MRRLCLVAAVFALLCFSVASASAWDVSSDFSTDFNPSGEWAYGAWWSDGFHAGTSITNHRGIDGLDGWGNADDPYYTPYVVQNTTNSTLLKLFNAFDLDSKAVYMHPGNQGDEGTIRWTAPSDGLYDLGLMFTKLDLVNGAPSDTQTVSVCRGATVLGSQTLSADNRSWTFSQLLALAQGDEIYLRVAADGDYNGDSTGVSGRITTPEPSSIVVLLGGLGSLLVFRRRRA